MDCSPPGTSVYGDSPGKNIGVGCHALLQGIFPTQGSKPVLPHCRRLSHLLYLLYCFTIWATMEAWVELWLDVKRLLLGYNMPSVQFSRLVVSNSLRHHESQHARPPCPSPIPGVYPNSSPLGQWCHPTISASVIPFSSCLQSFPISGSFQMSQLFASGGQNQYWSFSFNISPSNEHPGLISFKMDWLDLLAVQGTLKSLLQHHKSINSSVLCFLYSPTLTSIHDHWQNQSFD